MNFFRALCLLLICSSAHAQWIDRDGNRIPDSDELKSNSNFIARLIFVDDEQGFFDNWAIPSETVHIDDVEEIGINQPISSFVIFGGCRQDADGNCHVVMRINVTQPDGGVYAQTPLMEVWYGKPAPPGRSLEASVDYLKIIVEPHELRGSYLVEATVTDQNSGKSIELEKRFTAMDFASET